MEFTQQIAAAGGVLLVTPEYNNSVPGVLKNATDWLSRPSGDIRNVFEGKPVAVTGVSPGGFGTVLGQSAWLPVLRTLRARHWTGGRLMVSHARDAFDEAGNLRPELIASARRRKEAILQMAPLQVPHEVDRAVLDELPSGKPSATAVARTMALGPRALQRKLQREGTTFEEARLTLRPGDRLYAQIKSSALVEAGKPL